MDYNWNWGILFQEPYFGWLLSGLQFTLGLAACAWVIAFLWGSLLGIFRTTRIPALRGFATAYVELFRGVPLLLQLFIWYFVVPELLPESAGMWMKRDMPQPEFWTAVICLGTYTAARVAEQVRSVGGTFLEIDLGETGETAGGYAKELTPEQIEKQREAQKAVIAESDVVITTAQVFGRKPPVIVTRDMVEGMQPGSVVVDMAAETGGNVEGSVPNEVVQISGVTVIGKGNLPNHVCRDASVMYSNNLFNLVDDVWNEEESKLLIDLEHDMLSGCVITHDGEVVNETIKNLLAGGE